MQKGDGLYVKHKKNLESQVAATVDIAAQLAGVERTKVQLVEDLRIEKALSVMHAKNYYRLRRRYCILALVNTILLVIIAALFTIAFLR
jgi:hypothetical protein